MDRPAGPLLVLRDLTAFVHRSRAPILERVSFDVAAGESVGILGESGAGKTTLARSITRLLSSNWALTGSMLFDGIDILSATERVLQTVRGRQISQIFQEPELALSPFLTVGKQIEEVLRAHSKGSRRSRYQEVISMLTSVELSDPRMYGSYPHELSGGQRQRVAIAQALVSKPRLLIADEPTSALDNVLQAEILTLLRGLKERLGLSLIFITHNPALLSGLVDRVIVISEGRIIETGLLEQIYWAPRHPETELLLRAARARPV